MRHAKSKMLKHVLSDFHHYVERVRKVSLSGTKRAKESNEEHKRIVEALKARRCGKSPAACKPAYYEHHPQL